MAFTETGAFSDATRDVVRRAMERNRAALDRLADETAEGEPYVLAHGNDRDWSDSYRAEVCAWARSEGMVPENVAGVVVHPGPELFAVVTVYDVNEDGRRFFVPGTDEIAKHTETVPLSSLPPLPESTP